METGSPMTNPSQGKETASSKACRNASSYSSSPWESTVISLMSLSRSSGARALLEAFVMRDLPSSFASSPLFGQSFERQRMHQPGDGVGIGSPADQGGPLDLADFIGHLLQILRFNRRICKIRHRGGLVNWRALARPIRTEKGPGTASAEVLAGHLPRIPQARGNPGCLYRPQR
jgi:hypothetical protein